jgi:hypothetical protein
MVAQRVFGIALGPVLEQAMPGLGVMLNKILAKIYEKPRVL